MSSRRVPKKNMDEVYKRYLLTQVCECCKEYEVCPDNSDIYDYERLCKVCYKNVLDRETVIKKYIREKREKLLEELEEKLMSEEFELLGDARSIGKKEPENK